MRARWPLAPLSSARFPCTGCHRLCVIAAICVAKFGALSHGDPPQLPSGVMPLNRTPNSDWRDSETGLAFAPVPFDVNVALVPAALRAIEVGAVQAPHAASLQPGCHGAELGSQLCWCPAPASAPPLNTSAQPLQQLAAAGILDPRMQSEAAELAAAWEQEAAPFFEITVPASEASRRACAEHASRRDAVPRHVPPWPVKECTQAGYNKPSRRRRTCLLPTARCWACPRRQSARCARSMNRTAMAAGDHCRIVGSLHAHLHPCTAQAVAGGTGNLTFYALSLHSNGTKVRHMARDSHQASVVSS